MKRAAGLRFVIILTALILSSLACQIVTGGKPEEQEKPTQTNPSTGEEIPTLAPPDTIPPPTPKTEEDQVFDTEFPLPEDVHNFTTIPSSDQGINFMTNMSLEEVIAFYRQAFSAQELVERPILTHIEEGSFSMVFDGAPNGKATVIQGVALEQNTTNVNIRYEDV